ncbi:MAG: 50S ribosomal protein L23 [Chlamydiota bacterium]
MKNKSPYAIIQHRYVTEKSTLLESMQDMESNPSMRECKSPKYVFKVHPSANKMEIKRALEEIYSDIQVVSVHTINIPRKKRRVRGRLGEKSGFKKAIATLSPGNRIESEY